MALSSEMADLSEDQGVSPVNGTDDREAYSKSWIALYTRPRSEKKVKAFLDEQKIEAYLPVQKQIRQWSDRKKLVDVVIIPMVIFVNVSKEKLNQIINHPLILRPLTLPGNKDIAIIPNSQIEQLKFILGQSNYQVTFDPTIITVNDTVRVVRGSLIGITGQIEYCPNGSTELTIRIDLLGGARVKINRYEMELIKPHV